MMFAEKRISAIKYAYVIKINEKKKYVEFFLFLY